jgi:hypothetical protein
MERLPQGPGMGCSFSASLARVVSISARQSAASVLFLSHRRARTAQAAGALRFPEREAFLPIVRRAARLHHDQIHLAVIEPALEVRSGKTRSLDDSPAAISQRELKDLLCQIDCRGSRILTLPPKNVSLAEGLDFKQGERE